MHKIFMKYPQSTVIFLLMSLSQAHGQELVKTESGRTIILNANGTWADSLSNTAETAKPPLIGLVRTRNPAATSRHALGRTGYSFYFDPSKWRKGPEDANRQMFEIKSGDGYALIISERLNLPLENISQMALKNAQNWDPRAKIDWQELRTVNGSKVIEVQMSVTLQGAKFTYLNYYFSGKEGIIQIMTYCASNLYNELRPELEIMLNGFVEKL